MQKEANVFRLTKARLEAKFEGGYVGCMDEGLRVCLGKWLSGAKVSIWVFQLMRRYSLAFRDCGCAIGIVVAAVAFYALVCRAALAAFLDG